MLRKPGTGMPSDAISHRDGFDGHEPSEKITLSRRFERLGVRSTFAINTYYEEVAGGYYMNRALVVLIDRAMRTLGVSPVLLEVYRVDGFVPIEAEGDLSNNEEYALVEDSQVQVGLLQVWQFNAAGGGAYYGD